MIENVVNNKKYVGQSDNIKRRWKAHYRELTTNRHYSKHLQNAWNKYGENNFNFKIIEYCDIELLNEKESYWISYYDSYKNGYNLTLGGNGLRGYKFSEASKIKMKLNHYDMHGENNPMFGVSLYDVLNEEEIIKWKENLSKSQMGELNSFYGKTHTDETKRKISIANKGKITGEKHYFYGKKLSKEQIDKMHKGWLLKYQNNNPLARKVICLNDLKIYNSISDAHKECSIHSASIIFCCQHKNLSAGQDKNASKLVWMYYDEFESIINLDINNIIEYANSRNKGKANFNAKSVICTTTQKIFDTATEAGKFYNLDVSSIIKCCKHKIKYTGIDSITNEKLKWEYNT